jgi:hypothetical protein
MKAKEMRCLGIARERKNFLRRLSVLSLASADAHFAT